MFQYSALLIGFLGSFHCVAMCGPIAMALSGGNENNLKYLLGRTMYNFGRIVTYALMGLIAGFAGHVLLPSGMQHSLSVFIGILIIISVILYYLKPGWSFLNGVSLAFNKWIKSVFQTVLKKRSHYSLFIAGLANGVLPCGFVYLGLAGAASTQDPAKAAIYMALFGTGTFPAMMAVALFGKIAGLKGRLLVNKAAPVFMVLLGVLLIYRGIQNEKTSCCNNKIPVTATFPKSAD